MESAVLVFPTWRTNDTAALAPAVGALAARVGTVVALVIEVPAAEGGTRALDPAAAGRLERSLRAAGAEVRVWAADVDPGSALDQLAGAAPTRGPAARP